MHHEGVDVRKPAGGVSANNTGGQLRLLWSAGRDSRQYRMLARVLGSRDYSDIRHASYNASYNASVVFLALVAPMELVFV